MKAIETRYAGCRFRSRLEAHTCREARNWPEGLAKSVRPCEVCGQQAACSEAYQPDVAA